MKSASWKDVAEMVGITAIVVGLVLVTYELRQNNEQLAEQSRESVADGIRQITLSVATSPDLARLVSGEVSYEAMTKAERMQVGAWFTAWLKSAEHAYLQYQSGILDGDIWFTRRNQAVRMLRGENFGQLYQVNRDLFVPEFLAQIDEALKDGQTR